MHQNPPLPHICPVKHPRFITPEDTVTAQTALTISPSPTEMAAAIAAADAAGAAVRSADAVWAEADAAGFAAWSVLQRIEQDMARDLEAATDPEEIARLTSELETVELAVDRVFQPRYDA